MEELKDLKHLAEVAQKYATAFDVIKKNYDQVATDPINYWINLIENAIQEMQQKPFSATEIGNSYIRKIDEGNNIFKKIINEKRDALYREHKAVVAKLQQYTDLGIKFKEAIRKWIIYLEVNANISYVTNTTYKVENIEIIDINQVDEKFITKSLDVKKVKEYILDNPEAKIPGLKIDVKEIVKWKPEIDRGQLYLKEQQERKERKEMNERYGLSKSDEWGI